MWIFAIGRKTVKLLCQDCPIGVYWNIGNVQWYSHWIYIAVYQVIAIANCRKSWSATNGAKKSMRIYNDYKWILRYFKYVCHFITSFIEPRLIDTYVRLFDGWTRFEIHRPLLRMNVYNVSCNVWFLRGWNDLIKLICTAWNGCK